MKIYFIFLCLLAGGALAPAAVQISFTQDKPARVRIKSYSIDDNGFGIQVATNYEYGGYWNPVFYTNVYTDIESCSDQADWQEGVAGSGLWTDQDEAGTAENIWTGKVIWSWPSNTFWPDMTGTMTDIESIESGAGNSTNVYDTLDDFFRQEHCDINVSSLNTFYVEGPETFSATDRRTAQTAMNLQAGGKAIAGNKKMLYVTASATQMSLGSIFGDPGYYHEFESTAITNLPAPSIALGSYGSLNRNGGRYIVLSGGDDVDVTPSVAGVDYYNFNVGVTPVQTKADWQQVVQYEIDNDSGVQIENYQASNGFMTNRANIQSVYAFYQKVFTEQPTEFYWAGLAKLAGAPVYAGLSDAEYCKDGVITSGFLTLGVGGISIASVLASEAGQFQNDLIGMNIAVYSDLAWQFEAYKYCGLPAIQTAYAIDNSVLDIGSWQMIDASIQQNSMTNVQTGNQLLLQREQQQILAQGYSDLSSLFPGTTSLMSIMAQNPVVGGPSFSFLEPSGNLATFSYRWDWVSRPYTSPSNTGILPLWLHESSSTQLADVGQPLLYRAQNDFSLVYEYFGFTIY